MPFLEYLKRYRLSGEAFTLPRMVSAVLVLAMLAEVLQIHRVLWPNTPPSVFEPPQYSRHDRARGVDAATLVAAHLFGIPELDERSAIAATQEVLHLVGTFATDDPARGLAIVVGDSGAAAVYRVGEHMPGGLVLNQVFANRIIMIRGGALESLSMPSWEATGNARQRRMARAAEAAAKAQAHVRDSDVRQPPPLSDSGAVLRALNLRPSRDGRSHGIRVYGSNDKTLRALGFSNGDIIHEVDGVSMDTPPPEGGGVDLMKRLQEGDTLTLLVEHAGARTSVTIDSARLAAAAEIYRESNSP